MFPLSKMAENTPSTCISVHINTDLIGWVSQTVKNIQFGWHFGFHIQMKHEYLPSLLFKCELFCVYDCSFIIIHTCISLYFYHCTYIIVLSSL